MKAFELELQPLSLCGKPFGNAFTIKVKGDDWKQAFLNFLETRPGEGFLCRGYMGFSE
jgi:hypothetical protein